MHNSFKKDLDEGDEHEMCVSDLSTCTTHSHHTGMKVARTSKPENGDDGHGAARRVQDKVLVRD